MILASLHQISKSFGPRNLFEGLNFTIESGDRIGLIGPNGMGKSTLLKIIAGLEEPDSGSVTYGNSVCIGYLPQVPLFDEELTLLETILSNSSEHEWDQEVQAKELYSRLGLDQFSDETRVHQLSGGWRKRLALARELMKAPDLMLLDEPTNHLDVESIFWLERFLEKARFATVTVTHDRTFLRAVANQIVEIDRRHEGGLFRVRGGYESFVHAREQAISGQERREQILKNTLRRETEWLRQGAKARTTKQQARIRDASVLKEKVESLSERNQSKGVDLNFQSLGRNPKKLIEVRKISQRFGDKILFEDFDLILTPKSRVGLLGVNGAGKSTLIRTLIGDLKPSSGEVLLSEGLQVAYFDQNRDQLDPEKTVLETICPYGSSVDFQGHSVHARSYLSRFLFEGSDVDMKVGRLSGGEQARLLIARLMLQSANVLVLDEPTNDLDLPTLSVLEESLEDFNGAVLLVSHDRYFLDQITDSLIAFPLPSASDKRLVKYADLAQWRSAVQLSVQSEKSKNRSDLPSVNRKKVKVKFGYKETRELEQMEAKVLEAEAYLENLVQQSSLPEILNDPGALQKITSEMANVQKSIELMYERWQELEGMKGDTD